MKYEEIIDCPKSGGDLCYKIQVTPDINNFMSLSCGFYSNSLNERRRRILSTKQLNLYLNFIKI